MDLLVFARGPALWASLAIMLAGSLWKIIGIYRLGNRPDFSEPRSTRLFAGMLRGIFTRMIPRSEFRLRAKLGLWNAYVYHIGLAVIVFGYLPHIFFIERLTGLVWPALPGPLVYLTAGVTFISLLFALMERISDPVRRLLSTSDDYFSWFLVILAFTTGMGVISQSYPQGAPPLPLPNPLPLAIHLMSVELLFVWLPFGKLSHAFLAFASRGVTGAAQTRKGAPL
jgi:nitrate reductase gamma subunit